MRPSGAFWLLLGALVWLGIFGWPRSLHIPDEGRYVGVAWDMVRFDSTWTPLLNGLPYFHKPPLFYWLNEVAFLVFGPHEWAARLPSILISWFTVVALYLFVSRHRGKDVATLSVLALITMPYYYGASQYANLDMLVAGLIALTILAGAEAVSRAVNDEPHARWFAIAAGFLAALAVLSKGLIGVVLPGGVLFFWILATRRWVGLKVLLAPAVWLAFLSIMVPWFVLMEIHYPGFLHYFFVYQHFERYLSDGFNQQQPFWFFVPVVFGMSLPWSLWLVRYGWRRPHISADRSWFWLMGLWITVIVVFFSIPTSKLIGYTVPVLPALAVLIAEVICGAWKGLQAQRNIRWTAITLIASALACLIALTVFYFINGRSSKPFVDAFGSEIKVEDQFVFVDVYPFDMQFYTRDPKPAWVVLNWPALPKGDSWANELAEAGEHVPEQAKEVLITPDQVLPRICENPNRTYWFAAYPHAMTPYAYVAQLDPVITLQYGVAVWKLVPDVNFTQKWCTGEQK
ncbi:MAG: glycosyltransferase family 39 protein [Burkholderiaceae bacterium]|nr:glycosyltransferase family 39 protein [Burkholderiaceae bacterium]